MATVQDEAPIGRWLEVKPASETTESEIAAGEVDCEAEQGGDGEPDVAQGADGAGSEVARLLGPPLVLSEPEPAWGSRAASDAGHWRDVTYSGVLLPPGVIAVPEGVCVGRMCPPGPVGMVDVTRLD